MPGFLALRDCPPVVLLPQWILPKAIAAPREEIAFSHSSLEEEIDKFHFEEEETLEAQIVHISDAEETNRHSGVHALILVIARPDSTSEEEEDEMALNRGNKSLKVLMATRNKGPTSQEVPKS